MLAAPREVCAEPARNGVSITLAACVPIDREQFRRILMLELGQDFEYSSDARDSVANITLSCTEAGIELRLDDAVTRKSVSRTVGLNRVSERARSRLLALSAAELFTASWLELRSPDQLPLEPAGPKPPDAVVKSAARVIDRRTSTRALELESSSPVQLGAAFELAVFSSTSRLIPCLALHVNIAFSSELGLHTSIGLGQADLPGYLELSTGASQPAEVRVTLTSLLVSLVYRSRIGAFDLFAGGGARIGFAYLKGAPVQTLEWRPEASLVPWGGPAVVVGADYSVAAHMRITLVAELGPVAIRASAFADGRPIARLSGVWGIASLGFAWSS